MRRAFALLMTATACASAPDPTPAPSSTTDTTTMQLRVPNVLPMTPEHIHLDLGPVLVNADRDFDDAESYLLWEADRLGADAFVLEGRSLDEVYGMGDRPVASFAAGVAIALFTSLITGGAPAGFSSGPPTRPEESNRFYRAIRYVDAPPPTAEITGVDLPAELAASLAAAEDLHDQLAIAHDALVRETLEPATYERLRLLILGA